MSMALAPDVTAPAVPLAHGLTASMATPAISMQTSTTRKIPMGMLIRHVAVGGAYAAWATYVPAAARNMMTATTATNGCMGANQTDRRSNLLPFSHHVTANHMPPHKADRAIPGIMPSRCSRLQPLGK